MDTGSFRTLYLRRIYMGRNKSESDTAIANCTVKQKAHVGEQDWSGRFMLTDVWILQNNQ